MPFKPTDGILGSFPWEACTSYALDTSKVCSNSRRVKVLVPGQVWLVGAELVRYPHCGSL